MFVRRRCSVFVIALVMASVVVTACGVHDKAVPAVSADNHRDSVPVPVVIVLDSSISMAIADAPGPRIDAARRAVASMVKALPDNAQLGLTVYGGTVAATPPAYDEGCRDVQVPVPLNRLDRKKVDEATRRLSPRGFTPIAAALASAAGQLPTQGSAAIVLVSDGESTCDPDPCQAASDIKQSRPDITISTIGFRTGTTILPCVTERTGGLAVSADNAEQLESRLKALQDHESAARALTPDGVGGATVGMSYDEVRQRLGGFPSYQSGRWDGDRTVTHWLDCDWVFDANQTLVEIRARKTIDGVGEGVSVDEADRFYGQTLQENENPGSMDSQGNAVTGGRLRLYSTGRDDDSAWRITANEGRITSIALCSCRPHATASPTAPLVSFPDRPTTGVPVACGAAPVVSSAEFTHPTWGRSKLYALFSRDDTASSPCLMVADSAGRVVWTHVEDSPAVPYEKWSLASPAVDATGHLFVIYNPGRYDGVIALVPTPGGFAAFSPSYSSGGFRYYYAELAGPDGRTGYAIEVSNNDCNPSCADGSITSKTLQWNGRDYK